jgi:hypothetical protein
LHLMFFLDPLTIVTKGNMLGYISLHLIPPASSIEVLIHLITTRFLVIMRVDLMIGKEQGMSRAAATMTVLIIQFLSVKPALGTC